MKFTLSDKRQKSDPIAVASNIILRDYQKEAVAAFDSHENGVLIAPPGSGKTIMGLKLITQKRQSALIIVHRKQIYDQWIESVKNFLAVQKKDIEQYVAPHKTIKTPITIAMAQTLARAKDKDLDSSFGLVLVDECHHMPARLFRDAVTKLNPYYLYGLTATPKRKGNDEKLIYAYLGEVIHEIPRNYAEQQGSVCRVVEVVQRITSFAFPFKTTMQDFQTVVKTLVFDSARNALIASDSVYRPARTEGRNSEKSLRLPRCVG